MHSFFAELKKRGVLKLATAYLVVSWLVLEVGHTLFLISELPHLGMQIVFVLLAIGFPWRNFWSWLVQSWYAKSAYQPSRLLGSRMVTMH